MRVLPTQDNPLPTRANCRTLIDEPKLRKLSTLTAEPMRDVDRRLNADPSATASRTLMLAPIRIFEPNRLMLLPIRTLARTLRLEATCAKSKILHAEPSRAKLLVESEEPIVAMLITESL
jgi:hypothetical protein